MLILFSFLVGITLLPIIEIKSYEVLSRDELFNIFKLRQDVFVVEQNCLYEDIDENDKNAFHLLCYTENIFVATTRILDKNDVNKVPSIGRIASKKDKRKCKLGEMIINASISFIEKELKSQKVKISAQTHLEKYYNRFNFIRCSNAYDDVGIMHIDMIREGNGC